MPVSEHLIESRPLEDRGVVRPSLATYLEHVAFEAVRDPGYREIGRLSQRVHFDESQDNDTLLHQFATEVGKEFLGLEPALGSTATISIVTNASSYMDHTQAHKAASHWHQDFINTDRGFFFPNPSATRLVIATLAGTIEAVGTLKFYDAVTIGSFDPSHTPDKEAALSRGKVVIGTDGVLMKSECEPDNGEIQEAKTDRAYVIPHSSVHKTNPVMPDGRIFFQLDTEVV